MTDIKYTKFDKFNNFFNKKNFKYCEKFITINNTKIKRKNPIGLKFDNVVSSDLGFYISIIDHFICFVSYKCVDGEIVLHHHSEHRFNGDIFKIQIGNKNYNYISYADFVNSVDNNYVKFLSNVIDKIGSYKFDLIEYFNCNYCGVSSENIKKCSKCISIWYCNDECQNKDWKNHKSNCGEM